MNGVTVRRVEEDVFAVTISKADKVANHRHDGRCPRVGQPSYVPGLRIKEPGVKMLSSFILGKSPGLVVMEEDSRVRSHKFKYSYNIPTRWKNSNGTDHREKEGCKKQAIC